ncbi:MAG TPA: hypothetical protein VIG67_00985 [Yaniella sp.]
MVALTGGFGPFNATQLTGLFQEVVAQQRQQLQHTILHDVQYRAGAYYAIAEVHAQPPDGPVAQNYYGITTAVVPPGATGYHRQILETPVFVWQHPTDPLLPGLGLAATPAQVQRHFGPRHELSALQTVIYRPMNRAVFQARFAPQHPGEVGKTLFLKVLRAGEAQPLYMLHGLLAAADVPVVEPVSLPVKEVLALAGGHGMPLGEYIRSEGVHNRFDPVELIEILDRFPAAVMQLPHRPSWADRYEEFIATAIEAMPEQYDRLRQLEARLHQAHERLELGPVVPTHGDLYEAHILVNPVTGRVQHILDVDGAGPGYRVDDYACFIGHLTVLGHNATTAWGWQAARRAYERLAPYTHPTALAVRSAAVVISLIPTYQRTAEAKSRGDAYLRVAEALMDLV